MGGAARRHRGRRRARRDLRARRPRRRVEVGVVAPGDGRAARVGRHGAGRLRLAEGPARAAGGPQGRACGAACGPSHRRRGHRHRSCSSGRCSAATEIAPHVRRRPPGQARDRRRRPPDRPAWPSPTQAGFAAGAALPGDRPARRPSRCPTSPAPAGLELVPWSAELDEEARLAHVEAFAGPLGQRAAHAPRSGRSGTRATAASGPTSRCSPSTRPAARSSSLVLMRRLPAGLGDRAGRGVDQHGRHPARLARQGRGAAG